jgi:hypothetical protein
MAKEYLKFSAPEYLIALSPALLPRFERGECSAAHTVTRHD